MTEPVAWETKVEELLNGLRHPDIQEELAKYNAWLVQDTRDRLIARAFCPFGWVDIDYQEGAATVKLPGSEGEKLIRNADGEWCYLGANDEPLIDSDLCDCIETTTQVLCSVFAGKHGTLITGDFTEDFPLPELT